MKENKNAGDINELRPRFVISLHCNAFNRQVSGTEVLDGLWRRCNSIRREK